MKKLLLVLLFFTGYVCAAQTTPEYCVYLVKGKVTSAKSNAKPIEVKQKQLLYKNEVLTFAKNAELTLINRDDKLLVLNAAGSVKVNDLAKKFSTTSPSVTKNYLKLAFRELLDPQRDYASFKDKNIGGIRGGVSRGDGCDKVIFPISELKTAEDSVSFKWHPSSPSDEYNLLIYDSQAKEIFKTTVKDTQYIVNMQTVLQGKKGKFYWKVTGKRGGCENDPIGFEILDRGDEEKLVPNLIFQKGGNDLLSQLQIIDELEQDKWIYTALKYYATLAKNNPDDEPLLKSYVLFLLKYGFDEEAQKAWSSMKAKAKT